MLNGNGKWLATFDPKIEMVVENNLPNKFSICIYFSYKQICSRTTAGKLKCLWVRKIRTRNPDNFKWVNASTGISLNIVFFPRILESLPPLPR